MQFNIYLKKICLKLFFIFLICFSTSNVYASHDPTSADFNHDKIVDILDYNILYTNYGDPYGKLAYESLIANFGKKISRFASLEKFGFDPGLTKRLAATHRLDQTFYENCPDSISGKCYGTLEPGSGFYLLQPHATVNDNHEDIRISCKINQAEPFFSEHLKGANNLDGLQHCPHKFSWTNDSEGNLAAQLTVDFKDWTSDQRSAGFMGIQSNTPRGTEYMGGNNHPNIDNYSIGFTAKASHIDAPYGIPRENVVIRFLVGTGWYVPSIGKSFVLEMNLDGIDIHETHPQWRTNVKYTENHHFPNPNTTPLYLGGRYWGVPKLINDSNLTNVGEVNYHIDWTRIVKQLIADGDLPPESLGPYPASFYFGPEMTNPYTGTMTVSNIFMLESPSK